MRPFVIRSNVVERVTNYKLLGVQLSEDLKWNTKYKTQNIKHYTSGIVNVGNHNIHIQHCQTNSWLYALKD
jgi:hypothetical protein